jgi:hypothetical protein
VFIFPTHEEIMKTHDCTKWVGFALLLSILLAFSPHPAEAQEFSKKSSAVFSGLKDLEGSQTSETSDGAIYILAMGEEVESGSIRAGKAVILSAGIVKEIKENSITLKFKDDSFRTWQISERTPICDESGSASALSSSTLGSVVTVRWGISKKGALKAERQGQALSIRQGPIHFKIGKPSGRTLTQPILANHSCDS